MYRTAEPLYRTTEPVHCTADPDGHWIKAMVQEGDQLRIEDHDLHIAMAFIPVVKDGGGIRIRAFRIEKHIGGDESMHFVEDFDTAIGETGLTKKAPAAFAIKVLSVIEPPAEVFGPSGRP